MNIIKCRIEDCASQFKTEEAVASGATYLCANHPRSAQVEAVGRKYDPVKDEKDSDLHFQDIQFDPFISRTTGYVQLDFEGALSEGRKIEARDMDSDLDQDAFQKAERNR